MAKKDMSKKSMATKSLARKKANRNKNVKLNRGVFGKKQAGGFVKKQQTGGIAGKQIGAKKGGKPGRKSQDEIKKEEDEEEEVSSLEGAGELDDSSLSGSNVEGDDDGSSGEVEEGEANKAEDDKSKGDAEKRKREKRKFDFEKNSRTIFVGNLPSNLEHRAVAKMFKCCGPVEAARIRSIVPEKEKLSQKVANITKRLHPKVDSVNAYVVFKSNENDECISKALKMNGMQLEGHHIRVDRAKRPKAKKETLTSRKKSVFVGNLRFDIRDDDLINHFKKIGPVSYVRIVRDRNVGLGKGFGFVVFEDRGSVKKALELNETQFKGRSLRVKKVEQ